MPTIVPLKIRQVAFMPLVLMTVVLPAGAVPVDQVPNPRQTNGGWVTDMANILSDSTETQLNQIISELEANNGSEIAVVTVPDTSPSKSPKAFATQLFNTWGIGKKAKNNGVLFLISKQDRRVEIDTGYGIETILPNADVQKLIDSQIIPKFKQGNFDRGTLDGTLALVTALRSEEVANSGGSPAQLGEQRAVSGDLSLPLVLGAGLAAIGAIGGVGYRLSKRSVLLKPGGRTRTQRQAYSDEQTERQPRCSNCRAPMQKLAPQELVVGLTQTERAAQTLGSIKYLGWQCPSQCDSSPHVRAYVWNDTAYKNCPHCRELTATFTLEILEEATRQTTGRQKVTETCECCDHHREYEESISRLPDPTYTGAGTGAAAGSSWIGGYGGGGSSGGGDFGGGSSGGGGAGGSW